MFSFPQGPFPFVAKHKNKSLKKKTTTTTNKQIGYKEKQIHTPKVLKTPCVPPVAIQLMK